MTTLRQFQKLHCAGCGDITLHDGIGCVHRKSCGTTFEAKRVVIATEYDRQISKHGVVPGGVGLDSLTTNERRILVMLGTGASSGTVALSLKLSESSVRQYRYRLCQKLNLKLGAGRDVIRDYVQARNLTDEAMDREYVRKTTAVL